MTRSNWTRFLESYERRLDRDEVERALYEQARSFYEAEARRMRGDENSNGGAA
jgi:uncharacterized membrane protein